MRFLRAVQSVFVQKRRLALPDLYEAPLDAFGQDAVERLFAPAEVDEVLELRVGWRWLITREQKTTPCSPIPN